jgi:hypothetical protein
MLKSLYKWNFFLSFMGETEYYQVLGRAVDDGKFEDEIKNAKNDEELRKVVSMRTRIDLSDEDLADLKAAVKGLPDIPRKGPGGKIRR